MKKPNAFLDVTGNNQNVNLNDRSNMGSEAGLKDCSLIANKDGANIKDDGVDDSADVKNNTVDEFLEEEPPTLSHN